MITMFVLILHWIRTHVILFLDLYCRSGKYELIDLVSLAADWWFMFQELESLHYHGFGLYNYVSQTSCSD